MTDKIVVRAEMELSTEITVGVSPNMGSIELTISAYTTEDLRALASLLAEAITEKD